MLNYHVYVSTYSGDKYYQSFYAWTGFFFIQNTFHRSLQRTSFIVS